MKKFNLLHVYTLLSLALVGSHAVSPQVYWKSVLPNSPMPKAIKDLLYAKAWDDGKEEVSSNTASTYIKLKDQPDQSSKYEEKKHRQFPLFYHGASKDNEAKENLKLLLFYHSASKNDVTKENVKFPPLFYHGASKDEEAKYHLNVHLFILENDLHEGKETKVDLSEQSPKTAFLSKSISDSIPFSSKDLPEIYHKFSVKPNSMKAASMKQTLSLCEDDAIDQGEEKICATSLESMLDFATTKLGKNVKALSTELNAKENTASQKYTIGLVKKLAANKVVVCHRVNYVYAIFYCHTSIVTQAYTVSLDGADGSIVKSLAVCHPDTSSWGLKHLAFQVPEATPSTVPLCHFLPEDVVLWVPY